MAANFTFQDILGSFIAFVLFASIFVFPGYVSGWSLNLLSFRQQRPIVRFVLALPLSIAVSPILLFLAFRLGSNQFALGFLFATLIAFAFISWRTGTGSRSGAFAETDGNLKRSQIHALLIGVGWIIFAILFLVDLQSQGRLWLNSVSYDHATRVQVIQAITRTGVPPINSSYYPGHPEKLTFLYYFWYILCSLIDGVAGELVNARTALIASVAWCGLGMMATIGMYLHLRNKNGMNVWKSALLGIGALAISGLDIFPAMFFLIGTGIMFGRIALHLPGDIEHWNEQITTWISSFAWVPHHIAAMIACLTGLMLWQAVRKGNLTHRLWAAVFAGFGFASAFGLSVWVTVIFAIFWGVWMLAQFLQRERPWPMLVSGIIAMLAILPFLLDMVQSGNSGSDGGFPFALGVRTFGPLALFMEAKPIWEQSLVYLLALPFNYLFELGFFFLVAFLWPVLIAKKSWKTNPYFYAEMLLLWVVVTLVTFVRSSVIANNDFGWRGWLLGQFVLLIWGVDILEYFRDKHTTGAIHVFKYRIQLSKIKSTMKLFIVLGIGTTIISLTALRFWAVLVDTGMASYADQFSFDTTIGEKAYDGRQAFDYIDENTSENTVVQYNPRVLLDYPTGLYNTRQAVISIHTLYGVPYEKYRKLILDIGSYFSSPQDWNTLDDMCRQYAIDILIIRDSDALWDDLNVLRKRRLPLFINSHDAIFTCGIEK